MKKFNSNFKIGTYVKLEGLGWCVVSEINDTRVNIKVEGLVGSFPRGHVSEFTNIAGRHPLFSLTVT